MYIIFADVYIDLDLKVGFQLSVVPCLNFSSGKGRGLFVRLV